MTTVEQLKGLLAVADQTWTCVATCQVCGVELNRAEHVSTADKARVELAAPLVAICKVRGHSTFLDCNFAPVLTWTLEAAVGT